MVTNPTYYAAVMGDLVRSESATAPEVLHHHFNRQIETANRENKDCLASPLTITLGDEFQGLVTSLTIAATLVRDLRLNLLRDGIECRFVIGLVEIRTPVNPDKAWNMMGPGLSRARDRLNEKSGTTHYRFSLPEAPLIETLLDALGAGLTAIESGWTDRQRDDIAAAIHNPSAKDIAKQRGVSIHNIYKIRSSGKYDAYRLQWQAISTALSSIDREKGLS